MIKKSLAAVIAIAILVLAGATYMDMAFQPSPDENRNITNTDTYSDLSIDEDKREAIIRTFSRSQFEKFVKNDRMKIVEKTSGHAEGDLPNINLLKSPEINITFYDSNDKVISVQNPKVDIYDTQFILSNTGSEFKLVGGIDLIENGDSYQLPVAPIRNASRNKFGTVTLAISYDYKENNYISYTALTYSR